MKKWWDDNWPFVVIMCLVFFMFWASYEADKMFDNKRKERFETCMADIHNVYVCDTYARQHE